MAQSKSSPLLTIAIPVYNSGEYIPKTLQSVLSQIPEEFRLLIQLVIVDNASTDMTLSFIENSNFPCEVKLIKNPVNMGADFSTDKCGREASGTYIWFLGSQDALLPNAIKRVIQVCNSEEFTNIVLNFSIENELDAERNRINQYELNIDFVTDDAYEFFRKIGGHALAMSANIIKRSNYLQVNQNSLVTKNWGLHQRFLESSLKKELSPKFYFISDPVFTLMQEKDGWWTGPDVFLNFVRLRELQRSSWKRNFKIYLFLMYRGGGKSLRNSIVLGRRSGYKASFKMSIRLFMLCPFDPRIFISLFLLYSPYGLIQRYKTT